MFSAARHVMQPAILGGIVGAVLAGAWGALAGSLLGLAVGGVQEAERRLD